MKATKRLKTSYKILISFKLTKVGDKVEKEYYCPECNSKLEKIAGCGSISYFCEKCKKLISKKKILGEAISEK